LGKRFSRPKKSSALPEKSFLKQGGRKNKPKKSFSRPIFSFALPKKSFPRQEGRFFWLIFSSPRL